MSENGAVVLNCDFGSVPVGAEAHVSILENGDLQGDRDFFERVHSRGYVLGVACTLKSMGIPFEEMIQAIVLLPRKRKGICLEDIIQILREELELSFQTIYHVLKGYGYSEEDMHHAFEAFDSDDVRLSA